MSMSVEIILMAASINVSMTKEVFGASAAVGLCSAETKGIVTVNSPNIAFTVTLFILQNIELFTSVFAEVNH